MSTTSIPLGDAGVLRGIRDRARLIRLGLAAALVGVAVAAFLVARAPSLSPTPLLPPGSRGIIVLDLSLSVERATLDRMYTSLTQLAQTHDRFGLVLFSSRAYEALPPNTPASELGPFATFFRESPSARRAGQGNAGGGFAGAGFGGAAQSDQPVGYPNNPWSCCFSFGTEISDGLNLARSIVLSSHLSRPQVWLMSDLADDPADLAQVRRTAQSYIRLGIVLHVVGLRPKRSDQKFFESLLGARGTLIQAQSASQVRLKSKHVFPTELALAATVLALLLALNEFWSTPLRWGRNTDSTRVAAS